MSSTQEKIPLLVPYWDTRDAERAGARFNKADGYHVLSEDDDLDAVWGWLPQRWRSKEPSLLPEMLPVDTWEQNLRLRVTEAQWDAVRKQVYAMNGYRCEVCGSPGRPQLEAHEAWEFDDFFASQKMVGIKCLCSLCHKTAHLGIARRLNMYEEVITHMKFVNRWSHTQLQDALDAARVTWEERNRYGWAVDLSWIDTGGFRDILERSQDRFG